jgi:hypothetical protein
MMTEPIQIAVIAFVAAVLGGFLQAIVTLIVAGRQFRWQTKRENYVLFLQSITTMGTADKKSPEWMAANHLQIQALARVFLQGSQRVVYWAAKYQSNGGLGSDQAKDDFARLLEAMRDDIGGSRMSDFAPMAREALIGTSTS